MVFGAFAAVFGAACGKRRSTQVDCGRPLGLCRSPPLWTTKTNKIRGKVAAQSVYVLKNVDHWFWCFCGSFQGGLR